MTAWDEVAELYGGGASPFACFAEALAATGPGSVPVGVNASAEMLPACLRRVPGARLVRADSAALPWPAGAFDVAVAYV